MSRLLAAISLVICPLQVSAQSVTDAWLQQIGITCGGGQSEATRSEFDSTVRSQLESLTENSSNAYRVEDVTKLLSEFSEGSQSAAYKDYVDCVKSVLQISLDSQIQSGQVGRDNVVLDTDTVPAGVNFVKGGQKIALREGDMVGINSENQLLYIDQFFERSSVGYFNYRFADLATGRSFNGQAFEGEIENLNDECSIVPYDVDFEATKVSIIFNC
jgi:hypothetical protein